MILFRIIACVFTRIAIISVIATITGIAISVRTQYFYTIFSFTINAFALTRCSFLFAFYTIFAVFAFPIFTIFLLFACLLFLRLFVIRFCFIAFFCC